MIKIIFLQLLLLIGLLNGQQPNSNKFSFWGGCGAGISGAFHSHFHNSLQYAFGFRINSISVKSIGINNVESQIRKMYNTTITWEYPQESINSRSLQIGYTFNLRKNEVSKSIIGCNELNLSFYSGLSWYSSVTRGTLSEIGISNMYYNKIEENGIGLPIEVELEWRFNNHCGATTSIYSEINSSQSYTGLLVNFIVVYY